MTILQVEWHHNGSVPASKVRTESSLTQASLEVDDCRESDSGEYTVTVTNKYGRGHAAFTAFMNGN